jgi:hypothetical protein
MQIGGEEQLKQLVETFYYNCQRNAICLMGALTPEFATFDAEMQSMLRKLSAAVREWVAECLEEARTAGSLRFSGGATDRAVLLVSTLLSSLLLSRVEQGELFQRTIDQLLEDLGASWRVADCQSAGGSEKEENRQGEVGSYTRI